ncbi:hybrid signal transduction histidine kinase M [Tanacetum coccineum]
MTGSDATVLLSDKLSTVTHHHLLTRVPVKLDLENWNYGSWEYLFDKVYQSYEVSKYIHGSSDATSTSTPVSLTPEELKVDSIILSWIFTTLPDDLQARSHTIAMKAELRSFKLGDLSMDAYFRKIESITTILTSLRYPVSSEYVVTFALEGLPDKYDHVCGIMHHRDTFPDLKTTRLMLTTKEMWLMSKSQSLHMDSSSPMVLMAESGTNGHPSTLQVKSWRPCYNFAIGTCRFVNSCKFVHDAQVKSDITCTVSNSQGNDTNDLLVKLIGQLGNMGITGGGSNPVASSNVTGGTHVPLTMASNSSNVPLV